MSVDSSPDIIVKVADFTRDRDAISMIRSQVFQIEQGVDAALEFDGLDDQAVHFLAYLITQPVGTLRIRLIDQNTAKLERLAVLSQFRNDGIGKKLMQTALEFLFDKNITDVRIHAQEAVIRFYEKLGFVSEGERFEEAGIVHRKMSKRLFDPRSR